MMFHVSQRNLRRVLFLMASGFLLSAFMADDKIWPCVGFFFFGGLWFWLARRKARELDSPHPR